MLNAHRFACLFVLTIAAASAQAGEHVEVEVGSRTFSGYVGEHSDGEVLWLQSLGKSTKLQRPVRWSRVDRLRRADGTTWTASQAQLRLDQLKRPATPLRRSLIPADAEQQSYAEQALKWLGFSRQGS